MASTVSFRESKITWDIRFRECLLGRITLILLTDINNVERHILIVDGAIPLAGAMRN